MQVTGLMYGTGSGIGDDQGLDYLGIETKGMISNEED